MIYETIEQSSLLNWISNKQTSATPPPAWELESPSETFVRVLQTHVGGLRELLRFRLESGAVEVTFSTLTDFGAVDMTEIAIGIASVFDTREYFRWEMLDDEERGAPEGISRAVTDELSASIDGVSPVGPGGRVTLYGTQRRADVIIRHRTKQLDGVWRPAIEIQDVVNGLLGPERSPGARLRGTLGYFEASKLDRQRYLRPAFVFLLDRPTGDEGPRWRIATVAAATIVDGLSLNSGLESAAGGCP